MYDGKRDDSEQKKNDRSDGPRIIAMFRSGSVTVVTFCREYGVQQLHSLSSRQIQLLKSI
jgi:hypothetical protein